MNEMSSCTLMHEMVWTSLSSDISEDANPQFMHTWVLFPLKHVPKLKSKEEHRCHHLNNSCSLLCITFTSALTHVSLWCRWYSTLCLVLAMPCPFSGLATCGKILTFISPTGPAAADTHSTSDPYAQVPAFTICPIASSPLHTHTLNAHTDAYAGMSDTSWPLAVPPQISRREATCNVRGDFGVKEVRLESSHIARPAWPTQLFTWLSWLAFILTHKRSSLIQINTNFGI